MAINRIPLSAAQAGVYFAHLNDETSRVFNVCQATKINTPFDVERFRFAARHVIAKTPALNMAILADDHGPFQTPVRRHDNEITFYDLRGVKNAEQQRLALVNDALSQPFDLARDPLFRWILIQCDNHHVEWVRTYHHVVIDGLSELACASMVADAYTQGLQDYEADLPIAAYLDFIEDDKNYRAGPEFEKDKKYWLDLLEGIEPADPFESVSPEPGDLPFVRHHVVLGREPIERLNSAVSQLSATIGQVLLAAVVLLEAQDSGRDDITVARPLPYLPKNQAGPMTGMATNIAHLRIANIWQKTLENLIHEIAQQNRLSRQKRYGLEDIRRDLFPELPNPQIARITVNQMLFDYELYFGSASSKNEILSTGPVEDLNVTIYRDSGEQLYLDLCGNKKTFNTQKLERYAERLLQTISNLGHAAPSIPLASLPLISDTERIRLSSFNATSRVVPETLVPDLFSEVARRTPEATAVIAGEEDLSYGDLEAASNRLARYLIGVGAGPDRVIGICMDRSIAMIVAILGIMKSGAVYLPLDPGHPEERLREMLKDSQALAVLTEPAMKPVLDKVCQVYVPTAPDTAQDIATQSPNLITDEDRIEHLRPHHLAYLIYTSGSTGKPKAVGNTFCNIARLLDATDHWFEFNAQDCWTLFHSIAFDFSVWELWGALLYGGRLVVVSDEVRKSPDLFIKLLRRERVTVLNQTPSAFYQLTEELSRHSDLTELTLRYVIFGGEALQPQQLLPWYALSAPGQLVNMYGITETTVHVTYQPFTPDLAAQTTDSRIGVPIPDLSAHVLDPYLRSVPVGVWGELYISGSGLARGYVGRPGLTAERFVACPFGVSGSRMYRTGDLGRWRSDGTIEFGGRADDQVKLRGFRIEPGEIASVLSGIEGVGQAAVVLREVAGEPRLVAYLTAARSGDLPETEALRTGLSSRLPDYMIPSAFVELDTLPLTTSGKLDRRALPMPEITGSATYVAPRTAHEALLARLFGELTGADRVGAEDSFFALGGHSLLAMRLIGRIRAETGLELPLRSVFSHASVTALAHLLDEASESTMPSIVAGSGRDVSGTVQLSFGQERLWMLDRLEGGSSQYNIPFALELNGVLDATRLASALRALVLRHEPLRTVIQIEDGDPVGSVLEADAVGCVLELHNLCTSPAALEQHLNAVAGHVFDLGRSPSLYGRLLELAPERHVLALVVHHGAMDGSSLPVLMQELSTLYRGETLPPLPWAYSDHAAWQRNWLQESGTLERGLSYWRDHLSGAPEVLELPLDHVREADRDRRAGYVPVSLNPELGQELNRLAQESGTTVFSVLLSAWGLLLGRLARQDEVVIGTPVAGRMAPGSEALIGFFVNTLALRLDLSGDVDRSALLARVHSVVTGGLEHQDTPFEQVVDRLEVARSLSHAPLFQAMFAWQSQEQGAFALDGISTSLLPVTLEQAKFDVTLSLGPGTDGSITGMLEYDTDLFAAETAEHWVGLLEHVVKGLLAAEVGQPLSLINLVDEAEAQRLSSFNATSRVVPETLVPDLFSEVARRTPEATAVIAGEEDLSYGDLEAASNRLARYLIGVGAGPDRVIGICMDRSIAMIVAILGIMKSGAVYLPLDPGHPEERLREMLKDSQALAVLTEPAMKPVLDKVCQVYVPTAPDTAQDIATQSPNLITDEDRIEHLRPHHLAYLIYTSGSTGKPKAVGNTHFALVNLLNWHLDTHPSQGTTLYLSAPNFDVSVQETLSTLLSGQKLICITPTNRDRQKTLKIAEAEKARTIFAPMSMIELLAEETRQLSIEFQIANLIQAGEQLSDQKQFESLLKRTLNLRNHYGPTETHVVTAAENISLIPGEVPPIGGPIWNTQIHVLDPYLRSVPVGVWGELYISGSGLARGYVGRPGLTAERFVACPFGVSGSRMYRTGDLGRWRSDGTIEFGGRADDQVKLRGFRIEPGEIASVLSGIEGVGQAAVVLREVAGEPRLVAYLTAARSGDLPETEALRTGLSSRLPDYMIPSAFVELDTLPLTTSGKLDRRALPMPEITGSATYVAPRTAHEALLARLFGELTGADRVGAEDSFFALGGHSLLAMRLIGRIRAETGLELPLRSVFSHASVTALAHLLDEASESTMPSIVAGSGRDVSGTVQLSFGQERLWMLDRLEGGSSQYNIPFALELNGVLDATRLASALRALVLRHEPLRTVIQIEDGDPVGSVLEADAVGCVLELHNLCTSPAALEQHLNAVAGHVFDLGRSPSLYGRLLELAPERHVLALVVHHGAMDGSSLPVLMQELSTLYRGETLPPLPWAYSDHAAWQRNWLQESGTLERGLSYWRDHLSGAPEVLELPLDHVREADRDRRAGYVPVSLNPELGQELNRLAQESGTTVFSVLLSAWGLLLGRLARQDEVVIGTPVAGRMAPGSEALIGFFVNTLALRLDLSGDVDRSALLARVHSVVTGGLEHQDTPFEQVVDRLEVARSLSHAPLFQAMFAWQSQEQGAFALDGISTSLLPVTLEQAKFDVTLSLGPGTDGSITGMLEYDTDLFAAETAEHWVGLLEHVVKGLLAAEVGQPLSLINLVDEAEAQRLSSFNATSRVVPETLVPDLFSEVARRTPEATAVIAGEEDLSYGDLEAASNRLARYLIGVGAGPDRVIGICMDRSIAMIVAILGIMKSGAVYLPLDPGHPEERLREMLKDSQALAVLTEPAMKPVLDKVCQVYVPTAPDTAQDIATQSPNLITDEDRIEHLRPHHLAYLIYTSGSTGKPKAVGNTQAGLVNLIVAQAEGFDVKANDRVLQFASQAFDASVSEVLVTICGGGSLVLPSKQERNEPGLLSRLLGEREVSHATLPPALVSSMSSEELEPLSVLVVAGEACPPDLVTRFSTDRRFLNAYGPTETTVCATISHPLDPSTDGQGSSVTIGGPIWNTQIHVLDPYLRSVPVGVWGELYISGSGLARGYVGRPGLTAERFVACPFGVSGSRMYRTGDLGRWRSDGTIEFGGRADDQVKLRGFRIEPGEIASVLSGIEGVGQAAVVLREVAGEPRLVAYLTAARSGDLPETEALRTGLSSRLPDYMIPSAFVELDTLPLTTSGKLDRRALPMPEITGSATYVAPRTAHEALLARLFGELTGADRVGAEDSFFALGGHSLLAMRLIGRIRAETGLELPLRSVFSHASVTALAHLLDEASESTMPSIVAGSGRDVSGTVQLSFGQERLWMLDRLEGGSSQYNIPFALELNGVLDATRLASALRALVLRHEPLRTVIQIEDGDPVGSVLEADAVGCVLELHNLCTSPAALEQHLNAVAGHVFDLGRSPSLYGRLLELAPERHVLALVVHHGAMDGSSLPVLMQELSTLYRGETLPPLPWAYSDHAAWQRNWLQESGTLERGLSYWRDHLSGAPEVLELPLDHVREADRDRRAGYVPVSLNPELGQELNRLAQESGTTVFSVLLSAWGLLLGRLARQDEVVIGTPVAGRMAPGSEALIGFFVNTLALRLDLSGDVDRSALLARVHSVVTGGLEHQDTPFEQVVDRLEVARSLSHAPLFQAMFAWQSQEQGAFALDGISTSLLPVTLEQAKFDVTLSLGPGTDGSITGMLEYDTDLFAAETAEHWVGLLEHVVKGLLAAEVGQPLSLINLVDEAEAQRLSSFNATSRVVPETLVPDLFSEVARRTPEATAVIAGEEDLSYGDLEAASNRLARYLIGVGAGPDRVIGICMDRSIAMIVAILGIMKSGAVYLPLDPGHPEERLREMLKDSQALAVLTEPAMKPVLDKVCQVYVPTAPDTAQDIATQSPNLITDEDRIEHLRPHHLAYLIYTSGSTGKPKAVGNTFCNIARLLDATDHWFEFNAQDCWTLFHSIAFDFSVWELWGALLYGGRLVVVSDEVRKSPDLFIKLLRRERVTVLNQTPSAFYQLTEELSRHSDLTELTLRYVIFGGEALQPQQLLPWYALSAPGQLVNMYGITETTVHVTYQPFTPDLAAQTTDSRIGVPIPDLSAHVLDPYLRSVPVGVWGELYISGSGLARGYVGRPGLTAERFVACPFGVSGSRMYRTGDLGRWRSDGTIEFGGRADDQVKLRGFRIEPGEIASVLSGIEGVGQAAVVLREVAGEPRLVAYLTAARSGDLPETEALRTGLSSRLPDYMIPSAFVELDTLPLTTSGKLDRRALPMPEITGSATYVAPRTAHEALLARLFGELTGADRVGAEDSFFALGGHSLLAMRLIGRIRAETGLELPLRSVFSHASVTALAHLLDEAIETPPPYHPILPLKAGGKESPLFCIHPAGGNSTVYRQLAMSLNWDCPVYGLQARGVENPEDPPFESIEEMALTYWSAIQTIQPSGPYRLLGWSFGGTVAIEIVSLIMAAGHAVDLLIMLDSPLVSVSADEDPNSDANMLELMADNIGFDLSEVPPEKRKNAVLLKMIELELAPDDANEAFIEGIITAVENSVTLLEHHQPKAINCPVVYFKASDNMQQHIEKKLANLGSTDVTVINANMRHAQMCSDINSQIIASALDTPLSPRQK